MKDYQIITISTYNKIARDYQAKRQENAPLAEIDRFQDLMTGKKFLDAGTGPGRDAEIFAQRGFEVVGIDASVELIKLAKESIHKVSFITMDITHLEFANNSFDGVWCCAVLSHFKKEDIPLVLSELNRVLKANGILFTAVKMGLGEGMTLEREFFNYPRFVSYFSEEELTKYLQKANFQVIESYICNERERFGTSYRDIDFIFTFSQKKTSSTIDPKDGY